MAHVGTHDVLSDALVDASATDRVTPVRGNVQPVAEFYDMRPGEVVEKDAFRQARQMRGEWRRERYARLSER